MTATTTISTNRTKRISTTKPYTNKQVVHIRTHRLFVFSTTFIYFIFVKHLNVYALFSDWFYGFR